MAIGDIRIPDPGIVAIVAGILLIGLAVWGARNSRFPVAVPIAALACSAACVFYPRALLYHPGVLEVTAIDVGQGDSVLLISPEGKTLLIDAGGPTGGGSQAPSGNFEIGEDVVSPVLWSLNIRRLDAIALSHAHSDHMGGMPSLLRNFRPRVLWVGHQPGDRGLPGSPGRSHAAQHSHRSHGRREQLCFRRRAGRCAGACSRLHARRGRQQ